MNILELNDVKKSFGNRKVLDGVNLCIPEHTLFGFVGENGAGKTTTMKLIVGLLEKDSGEIKVHGESVHYGQTSTNRFIGFLPDVPEFYSFMTPREYLNFCGEITGMNKKDIPARVEEMLSTVGLKDEKHRIKGFSRGMKQRLGIAQALLSSPELLICDEPTSALDPVGRKDILDILQKVKEKTTVIFSTHILSDVERICDEIAFLHKGRIVLTGTIEDIKNHHKQSGFIVETEKQEDCNKLLSAFKTAQLSSSHVLFNNGESEYEVMNYLAHEKISVVKFEKLEPSLESLFMEVVGK